MAVRTEKELAQALKDAPDTIEIKGDLGRKIICIKATGKVAWAVAIGAIGVAVVAILYPVPEPTTQGGAKGLALLTGGAACTILGAGTAATAIAIAVAAGGVGVLNKLREYTIVSKSHDRVVLQKK